MNLCFFRQYALTIASISGAVINLIIIMILGRLYEIIAYKLTQWGLFSWGKKNEELICLGFLYRNASNTN